MLVMLLNEFCWCWRSFSMLFSSFLNPFSFFSVFSSCFSYFSCFSWACFPSLSSFLIRLLTLTVSGVREKDTVLSWLFPDEWYNFKWSIHRNLFLNNSLQEIVFSFRHLNHLSLLVMLLILLLLLKSIKKLLCMRSNLWTTSCPYNLLNFFPILPMLEYPWIG